MNYHHKHLCTHCGERFEEHAGWGNPTCPEGRCPGIKFPRLPEPTDAKDNARYDRQVNKFWSTRKTVFKPI